MDSIIPHPLFILFYFGCKIPQWAMASSFTRFQYHTYRRTTVGRTPLDEWSALFRDLYLTTHNTLNRQTSMPPVGFEPTNSEGDRQHTYTLDRAATGTGPSVPSGFIYLWRLRKNFLTKCLNPFALWYGLQPSHYCPKELHSTPQLQQPETVCLYGPFLNLLKPICYLMYQQF